MIASGNSILLLIHPTTLFNLDMFDNFGNSKTVQKFVLLDNYFSDFFTEVQCGIELLSSLAWDVFQERNSEF